LQETSRKSRILVVAELRGEKIHPISFELLSKGREIAEKTDGEVCTVVLGDRVERNVCLEFIHYGADKVFFFNSPLFSQPNVLNFKHNLVRLIKEEEPDIILIGATHFGKTLAPRVAAALKTGLTADCIDLQLDEKCDLVQIRPAFTGNILAHIKTRTKPVMSTIRYKVMNAGMRDLGRKGEIIEKHAEAPKDRGVNFIGRESSKKLNIADAEIIVSGGRGLGSAEGFKLLKELADLLGGVVGSSRTPVDEGWISKEHQVGFSGNTVKPRLYIACGISGSSQHLAGMKDSGMIIAINTDPSAPIFKVADYGIVGDLYQTIPLLIKEIKAQKEGKN